MSGKYDLSKIREKLKQMGGKQKDPLLWTPPKAKEGETHQFRFFVLPPVLAGNEVVGGQAVESMDTFSVASGKHFINNRVYICPRVATGDDCPVCKLGFELLNETQDKKERSAIAKSYLPSVQYFTNIYFPDINTNPPELRGKVFYYGAPKTVFDMWQEASMRDNMGDPEDPKAFGAFFDEEAAFLYQLEVKCKGDFNSYETSKFLVGKSANGTPIASSAQAIKAVLARRIDILHRLESPDVSALKRIVDEINGTTDAGSGSGSGDDGFDHVEKPKPKVEESKTKVQTKSEPKAETKTEKPSKKVDTDAEKPVSTTHEEAPFESDAEDSDIEKLLAQINGEE